VALDRAALVEIRVTDPDGAPLEGVRVWPGDRRAMLQTQGPRPRVYETGADGMVRIDHQRYDEALSISAWRTGYLGAQASVMPPTLEPHVLVLEPGLELVGSVSDLAGRPIVGAAIRAEPVGPSVRIGGARSDPAGGFLIAGLPAGEYRVVVDAEGYVPELIESVLLEAGVDPERLEVRLSPGALLEGLVTDRNGRPLEGATVTATRESSRVALGGPGPPLRDHGDAEGRYRLEGLPLGASTIAADAQGHRGAVRDVVLEEGANRLDFELDGALEISGRVLGPDGLPVAGANVLFLGASTRPLGRARTDAAGEFRDEIDDGVRVILTARKDGVGASPEVGPILVQGASISGVELRLEGGGAISGQVHGLDLDQMARVGVVAAPAHERSPWSRVGARPDYEGRFRIEPLTAGEWIVTASLEGRSARASVSLPDAASESSVDLVFEPGYSLTGTVLDGGTPAEGLTVRARGTSVLSSGSDLTGPGGRFEMNDLPAGSYRLEVPRPLGGARHQETVELDGDRDLLIELPGGRVSGRVVDEGGAALAGAAITLHRVDEPLRRGARSERSSGGDGGFRFEGIAAGSWIVEARKEGYVTTTADIEVDDLGADGLRLELVAAADDVAELFLQAPLGSLIRSARIALRPAGGGPIQTRSYVVGEGGRVVLDDVPPGRWLAAVSAGSLVAEVDIAVPAPPRRVPLQPPSWIEVVAPELLATGTVRPVALFRAPPHPLDELWTVDLRQPSLVDGRTTLGPLPAGTWTVSVELEPGRMVERSVTLTGDQRVRVEIE
jgi:hypothetical protein